MTQAIRMIGHLDRGLATRAQRAMVDGMLGQSLELLGHSRANDAALAVSNDVHVGIHDAHVLAATGRAERANRWLPHRNPRHEIVVGDEPDDLVFGMAAACQRRAGASDSRHLEKSSSVHLSSDRPP
jgi:hypothetical protein